MTSDGYVHSYDGTRLYYKEQLCAEPKAAVLVLHGLCGHLGRFDYLADGLYDEGYSVFRFDMRGHGLSEGCRAYFDSPFEPEADLHRIVKLIKSGCGQLPFFIIAHSMGGFTAAMYAIDHSDMISGVVFSSALTHNQLKLGEKLPSVLPPKSAHIPLGVLRGLCSNKTALVSFADDPLVQRSVTLGLFYALGAGIERIKRCEKDISCPALILHGTSDGIVSTEDSKLLYENISSADKELIMYSGLCHELFHEVERERVLKDVISWLNARI